MERLGAFTHASKLKRLALKLTAAAAASSPSVLQFGELDRLKQLFSQMDDDGDGFISGQQLHEGLASLGTQLSETDIAEMLLVSKVRVRPCWSGDAAAAACVCACVRVCLHACVWASHALCSTMCWHLPRAAPQVDLHHSKGIDFNEFIASMFDGTVLAQKQAAELVRGRRGHDARGARPANRCNSTGRSSAAAQPAPLQHADLLRAVNTALLPHCAVLKAQ